MRHAGDLEPPGERKWQSRGSGASRLETMRHAEDLKSPEQKETARNGICDLGGANLGIRSYLNKFASLYSLRHSATKIAAGICDWEVQYIECLEVDTNNLGKIAADICDMGGVMYKTILRNGLRAPDTFRNLVRNRSGWTFPLAAPCPFSSLRQGLNSAPPGAEFSDARG